MSLFDTLWQGAQGVAALPFNALTGDLRGLDRQIFPDAAAQAALAAQQSQPGLTQPNAGQGPAQLPAAQLPASQAAGGSPASQFMRGPFMRAVGDLRQSVFDPVAAARATSPPGALPGTTAAPPEPASSPSPPVQAPSINLSPAPRGGPGVAPAAAPAASGFPAAQGTAQPAVFTLPILSPQQASWLPSGTHFVSHDLRVMQRT